MKYLKVGGTDTGINFEEIKKEPKLNPPSCSIYSESAAYIPDYKTVDEQRNDNEYMMGEIPDIDFLNSLSDKSITNLLVILKDEQKKREIERMINGKGS